MSRERLLERIEEYIKYYKGVMIRIDGEGFGDDDQEYYNAEGRISAYEHIKELLLNEND